MKLQALLLLSACLGPLYAAESSGGEIDKDDFVDAGESSNEVENWSSVCADVRGGVRIKESQGSMSYDDGITIYTLFYHYRNFSSAEAYCHTSYHNGHLTSIHNYHTNRILTCLTTHNNRVNRVWIGGYGLHSSRRFKWTDGTRWNYSRWIRGFPVWFSHPCVELNWRVTGTWSDHHCHLKKYFVCEHRH